MSEKLVVEDSFVVDGGVGVVGKWSSALVVAAVVGGGDVGSGAPSCSTFFSVSFQAAQLGF